MYFRRHSHAAEELQGLEPELIPFVPRIMHATCKNQPAVEFRLTPDPGLSRIRFILEPSECRHCGFAFRDRSKITRPSRCGPKQN